MSPATAESRTALGDHVMKVDHAGEHGAIHIYRGQILAARITAPDLVPELVEFKAHEERHRAIFAAELGRRGVRRCRSAWLCAIGGFTLGVVTGLLGRAAIHGTTAAVERVVLRHLAAQLAALAAIDRAAATAVSQIVDDEQRHFDDSARHLAPGSACHRVLDQVVGAATESVIWVGMRI